MTEEPNISPVEADATSVPTKPKRRYVRWREALRQSVQADLDAGLSNKQAAERNGLSPKTVANAVDRRIVTRMPLRLGRPNKKVEESEQMCDQS